MTTIIIEFTTNQGEKKTMETAIILFTTKQGRKKRQWQQQCPFFLFK